jgi:uncharacterized membrane protein
VGVTLVCVAGCIFLYSRQTKKGIEPFPTGQGNLIFWEEVLFLAAFLLWTYLAGFRPQAYGTEKFMDYGFMEAMMRSTTLPATDLWYSEGTINYYYGGQYFAVFLTKMTGSKVEVTYNLMRTFVAGLAFIMPFSLVWQMTKDRLREKSTGKKKKAALTTQAVPAVAGVTAGLAVSIAGNMHYVVYKVLVPFIAKLKGEEYLESYWFPDATRYIGYNPDVPDKTIHEFPCYSFILGDLHAHVVNIMFVLFLVGLLYAWMRSVRTRQSAEKRPFLIPHILIAGVILGMFQWTNYWDFVIYFVVTGGVVLFTNIIQYEGNIKKILSVTAIQAAEVLAIAYIVILPFTLQFTTMVQGVALAQKHSLPYQLLVLWGLPAILTVAFLVSVLWEKLRGKEKYTLWRLMKEISYPDLFAVITGLCAMGLVLIPELVYVRDIYEGDYSRANTMFKLTYQAFILFGITMGYVIFRLLCVSRQKVFKILSGCGLFCLLWTVGYFGCAVDSWFGDVWDTGNYQGLNATAFLETDFPEDVAAIQWLKENVTGSPVVLEANGDSYTGYERVSAMTGLPTILGWYVHEWLWRNDVADLNEKSADVETIYTSQDVEAVKTLLSQYNVSYIFVGSMEREKYGDALNEETLNTLGSVVFQDENSDTYILKLD